MLRTITASIVAAVLAVGLAGCGSPAPEGGGILIHTKSGSAGIVESD